jgi:tetratricopeptide (TPR) repeat protein
MLNGDMVGEAETHFQLACEHEAAGRWKKALEECDAALSIDASFADAHNLRGIALEELDLPQEAADAYESAISLERNFHEAIRNLWELEREQGIQHELVTIATFTFPMDAFVPKTKLESEGIWAFVADEELVNVDWRYCFAIGRVKLQVRDSDVERALRVLEEPSPPLEHVENDQPRCPACGSHLTRYEKCNLRLVFASWLLLGVPLPLRRARWRCWDCHHRWKTT